MQSRACKMLDFSVPIDPPVHGTLPSLTLTLVGNATENLTGPKIVVSFYS